MRVPIKGLGEVGFIADQEGFELPPNALTDCNNVRMYNGWAERIRGHVQLFGDTSVTPYGIWAFNTASKQFVVHAGKNAIFADDGITRYDITGTAPTAAYTDKWTGGNLGGVLIGLNPKDPPWYWDGTVPGAKVNMPGWDAADRVKFMRPFGNYAVCGNLTKSGLTGVRRVKWSSAAEPGAVPTSWDEADATNDAGEQDVEGEGALIDCMTLGDTNILYLERSMVAMTYAGGEFIFNFQPLPDPVGMLAANCGAKTPKGHVVLTQGDVILNTGNGVRSLLNGKARNWLNDNMDQTFYAQSFVVANQKRSEVWVCFPSNGAVCNKAIVWNWETETVFPRDMPDATCGNTGVINFSTATIDSISSIIDTVDTIIDEFRADFAPNEERLFVGSSDGKILGMEQGTTFDGDDFEAYIERTGLHFDQPDVVKDLKRAWPRIDANAGTQLQIYLGASNDPDTAPTYSDPVTFTVGTDQWIDSWAAGRYLAWKIAATGSEQWRTATIDLDVQAAGAY